MFPGTAGKHSASAASGRQTSKEDPQRDNWKTLFESLFLVREGEGVKKIRKKVWPFAKPGGGRGDAERTMQSNCHQENNIVLCLLFWLTFFRPR